MDNGGLNASVCSAIKEDFSVSSRMISSHRHVLLSISVISAVVGIFIVLSNITLMVALIRSKHNQRDSKVAMTSSNVSQRTRQLMASASVCNALTGLVLIPAAISQMIHNGAWVLGAPMCTAKNVLEVVIVSSSNYHFIFQALDMYMAVCWPLKYRMLTPRSSYLMVLFSWALPMGVFIIPMLFGWHKKGQELLLMCLNFYNMCSGVFNSYFLYVIVFVLVMIPFSALVAMYLLILRAITKFHKRLPAGKVRRLKSEISVTGATSAISFTPEGDTCVGLVEISTLSQASETAAGNFANNLQAPRNRLPVECDPDIQVCTLGRNDTGRNVNPAELASSNANSGFRNFRKSCRSARAFRYVLFVLPWSITQILTFVILRIISIIRPDLTPRWFLTAMWWSCYINSAAHPLLLCSNVHVRRCVEISIGVKLF